MAPIWIYISLFIGCLFKSRNYSFLSLAFIASSFRVTEENLVFETVQSGPYSSFEYFLCSLRNYFIWCSVKVYIGFCNSNETMQAILRRKDMYKLGSSIKKSKYEQRDYILIYHHIRIDTFLEKGIPDLIVEMHIRLAGLVAGIE